MRLGLRLSIHNQIGGGGDLDFSAFTALPVGRQSAVTTAANAAATTLGVSTQNIIDALAVGRGVASLLPDDGCLLASSGGSLTSQGDPVGAIRTWTGVEISTQSNASLQPISGVNGLVWSSNAMETGDLSAWTEGEGLVVLTPDPIQASTTDAYVLWTITEGIGINGRELAPYMTSAGTSQGYWLTFGAATRSVQISSQFSAAQNPPFIYQPRASSATQIAEINGVEILNRSVTISFPSSGYFGTDNEVARPYVGTWHGVALNGSLYSANQRDAVREFCKEYYGVTY